MKRISLIAGVAFGLALAGATSLALASRNSVGTYSLTAGQPVVSGTTVSSSTFNTLTADLATEITNSLDRNGRGGMLAALRGIDGTVAAPALSFTSEPGTGLYRAGAGNARLSVSGADAQTWTGSGSTFASQVLHAAGTVAAPGVSFSAESGSGLYRAGAGDVRLSLLGVDLQKWSATSSTFLQPLLAASGSMSAPALSFSAEPGSGLYRAGASDVRLAVSGADVMRWLPSGGGGASVTLGTSNAPLFAFNSQNTGIGYNIFWSGTQWQYNSTQPGGLLIHDNTSGDQIFYTVPSGTAGAAATLNERLRIKNAGNIVATAPVVANGGLTVGSSGTAISGSFRGTTSWAPGSITAGTCITTAVSVPNAAINAECHIGFDQGTPYVGSIQNLIPTCFVHATGTCTLQLCNPTGGAITGLSNTYACRVWNP